MNNFFPKVMWHGADYNYEQWLDCPDVLARDFELMKLANCNVMSVGIFSWAMLEPAEGEYRFEWLDTLMDRLAANDMGAILATPSAARPLWLSQAYPEVCLMDDLGRRQAHHGRHNHCPTSPIYREKVNQINTLLAERYGSHPALRLWHVSNEYGNYGCRCELCLAAFRDWLKARYGTLDALNHAWWTTFWSHRYTDWSQIAPVDKSVHGLLLDWMRFVSDQVLDFYLAELEPLRAISPDVPVTTNFMRPDVGLDYWQFAPHVDVVSWDNYPRWHATDDDSAEAAQTAFFHDLHRSYKQQPFLMMESTPSVTNWQGISRQKRPGMHALSSLQAVAHGANSVQYFQWRQSRGGEEKFHGAVVALGGEERTRIFREVSAVGEQLAQLDNVTEAVNSAEVALIYDFQNEWALELAALPRSQDKQYQARCVAHYRPFWQQGVTVDVVSSTVADLSGYKLVIAPMLYLLQPGVAERLTAFVEAGGTLVATYLTGLVDQSDLVFLNGTPGPLAEVLGLWVEETDALTETHEQRVRISAEMPLAQPSYSARHYTDWVQLRGAQALASYELDYLADSPAVTVNAVGEGRAFYVGARLEDAFLADFYGWLSDELGLISAVGPALPAGVTAQVRHSDSERFLFLMNFTAAEHHVTLDAIAYRDAATGEPVDATLTLPSYGLRILAAPR